MLFFDFSAPVPTFFVKGLPRGLPFGALKSLGSTVSEPKTKRSRSPIPVVRPLAEALEAHRLRAGKLAQSNLPIFQAGNGQPLNLGNIARRVITPALSPCAICGEQESAHSSADGHTYRAR